MPAGDNPHSISEKKSLLRESPKQPKSVTNEQRTFHCSRDNAATVVGVKRAQPNGMLSPTNHHMLGNSGANGHLVYVRRRLETDQRKGSTSASAGNINSLVIKKAVVGRSQSQEPSLKHQDNIPNTQSAAQPAPPVTFTVSPSLPSAGLPAHHSIGKQSPGKVAVHPTSDVITSLKPHEMGSSRMLESSAAAHLAPSNVSAMSKSSLHAVSATSLEPNQADQPRSSNQDCSDRFVRLQVLLRNNEQSGQEEYIRMLRSLSPVGRTKHAFELEQRAANLLVEEGKELQKMKVLNVLGSLMPGDSPSFPSQSPSFARLPFPARQ